MQPKFYEMTPEAQLMLLLFYEAGSRGLHQQEAIELCRDLILEHGSAEKAVEMKLKELGGPHGITTRPN